MSYWEAGEQAADRRSGAMPGRPHRWFGRRAIRRAGRDAGRGLLMGIVSQVAGIPLLVLSIMSMVYLLPIGLGLLLAPVAFTGVRRLAEQFRRWSWEWSGVRIESPYRPRPLDADRSLAGKARWLRWRVTDPATWRDLLWMVVNIPVGMVLGALTAGLLFDGALILAYGAHFSHTGDFAHFAVRVPIGAVMILLGLRTSSLPLTWHARFTRSLLSPSARELERRVGQLTDSRAEVVDSSAAELRRIERDLHDGAQARLAALGMNIGLAEQLMRTDPEQALALMAEARQSSGQALIELRTLVRGIHPPVLAERGLEGAVRALVLTIPLPVAIHADLPGRPPAPVESALYFAVAELLANVLKHSAAQKAWVELRYARGALIAVVGDDGIGGAAPGAGTRGTAVRGNGIAAGVATSLAAADGSASDRSAADDAILGAPQTDAAESVRAGSAGGATDSGGGLRGIERRLAAFDGITAVTSPAGGPTVITLELPCVLSSARI